MKLVKNFADWFKLKPALDKHNYKPPKFSEKQVWFCHCGENIGVEVCGKGSGFLRPYLVLKKLDKFSFIGLPLSTKDKVGDRYVSIYFKNKMQIIYLHQPRHLDYRRMKYKMGEITEKEFSEVQNSYLALFQSKGKK